MAGGDVNFRSMGAALERWRLQRKILITFRKGLAGVEFVLCAARSISRSFTVEIMDIF